MTISVVVPDLKNERQVSDCQKVNLNNSDQKCPEHENIFFRQKSPVRTKES
jgi:hypothetical protein